LPLAHSTGAILISTKYLEKLPQDLSKLFSTTMDKDMTDLTLILRKQNEEATQIIQDSGLTIIPGPSGSDLEDFYGIHDQVAQRLTDKIYPKEILNRIYGLLKRPE